MPCLSDKHLFLLETGNAKFCFPSRTFSLDGLNIALAWPSSVRNRKKAALELKARLAFYFASFS